MLRMINALDDVVIARVLLMNIIPEISLRHCNSLKIFCHLHAGEKSPHAVRGLLRFSRMRKKAVQQGRSERRGEEVHTKLRLNRSLRSHASG